MKSKNKKTFRIQISAATENLEIIRGFIQQIAQKAGFSSEQIDQIQLAVDEACTNAIKHAYHLDTSKMIDLDVTWDEEKLEILVTDYGPGFDPDKLDHPDLNQNAQKAKPGGLGIHLMKTLMDVVDFRITPGSKTQVRLVKYKKPLNAQKPDVIQ